MLMAGKTNKSKAGSTERRQFSNMVFYSAKSSETEHCRPSIANAENAAADTSVEISVGCFEW
jgi:hypothetical protein